jgi:hypothetical protein
MKYPSSPSSLALMCLGVALTTVLSGCAGMDTSFPDATAPVAEIHPGAIHGSVFGGHAPIAGAHVYVLQAGQSGYASAPTSKITTGFDGTDSSLRNYVLTDNNGNFNINNDYTCTTGHVVYLAAVGGAPAIGANIAITGSSATSTLGVYTIVFTGTNTLGAGQTVSFAALSSSFAFAALNNTTQTVTAATPSTFTITYTPTGPVTGSTNATSGVATANANPAIDNLAVAGVCPGVSGEFGATIHFVYVNEVSTAAAAYALAGFGTGPFTIGSASTTMSLQGIANAAYNANQLYDIQGGNSNGTAIGEGHIARSNTVAGNGIVPQDTLDTLGNILASCVDSPNTSLSTSINCATLFNYATSNGIPATVLDPGTVVANNTATAAFNIARNPAGNPSYTATYMAQLFLLQGSQAMPFNPALTSAPNDFTVGIQYPSSLNPGTGTNPSYLKGPESIVADGVGTFWFTTQPTSATTSGYFGEYSSVGVLLHTPAYSNTLTYGNIALDSSGNAWSGTLTGQLANTTKILATTGVATVYGTSFTAAAGPVADNSATSGNLYMVHGPTTPPQNNQTLTVVNSGGGTSDVGLLTSSLGAGVYITHGAIDGSNNVWFTSDTAGTHGAIDMLQKNSTTPNTGFPITSASTGTLTCPINSVINPEQPAIDNAGNAWIPLYGTSGGGNTVMEIMPSQTFGNTCYYWTTGHGPYGAAVDGANNVWITNRTDNSVTELSAATGFPISPATNYMPVNQVGTTTTALLKDPVNITVDISGDLMISNFAGNSLVELIGVATPTYAPLGVAAAVGKLGSTP